MGHSALWSAQPGQAGHTDGGLNDEQGVVAHHAVAVQGQHNAGLQ